MSCCAGEYWDDTDEVEGHDGIAPDDDKTPMTALVELILRAVQNALIYGYRVRFLHTLTYQIAGIKSSIGFIDLLKKIWKSIKLGVDHGKILAFYAIVYRSSLMLTKKLRNFEYNRDLLNHFIAGFAGGIFIYGGVLQKLLKKQSLNEKTKPCCQTGKLAPARSSSLSTLIENILGLNESIVTQITLYTVSRLVLALGRDLGRIVSEKSTSHRGEGHISNTKKRQQLADISWTITCGLVWGGIMVYYQRDRRSTKRSAGDGRSSGGAKPTYLPRAMQMSLEFIYGGVRHAWKEAFDYNSR